MKLASLLTLAVAAAVSLSTATFGQVATTAPVTAPTTQAATQSARAIQDILGDLQQVGQDLDTKVGDMKVLLDPAKRAKLAPIASPLIWRMCELLDEAAGAAPRFAAQARGQKLIMLAVLKSAGDDKAVKTLTEASANTDQAIALDAKTANLLGEWWVKDDAVAQKAILEKMSVLTKANPTSDVLPQTLALMATAGNANKELAKQAKDIIVKDSTAPMALMLKEQIEADRKLEDMIGKPFVLSGKTVDDKDFAMPQLKGKVVVIDFWATWCPPCREETPNLIKLYQEYQKDGLEIVGVSLDRSLDPLKEYVTANKGMNWIQIWDEEGKISKGFNIESIPQMFVVDRAGNLHTTEGRGQLEKLIPTLLKAGATTQAATQPTTQPTR
ncbi:MAG: TlpA disulfide reductase family protein [Phycisphaerae bacterium]